MIGGIGMPELIVIFVIALLVLGPSRLPGVAKSLGQAIRGFKRAMSENEPSVLKKPEEPTNERKRFSRD